MSVEDFAKKKSDLEEEKALAEASFDGEKVGELEKALKDLEVSKAAFEAKAENAGGITENQEKQITELGGNEEELTAKTAEVDGEIESAKGEVMEEVKEKTETQLDNNPNFREADAEKLEKFKEGFNNEFDLINQEVTQKVEEYLKSGELEQTKEYQDALADIESGQSHKDWQNVRFKINKVSQVAGSRLGEIVKPLEKFQTKLQSNLSFNLEGEKGAFLEDLYKKVENTINRPNSNFSFGVYPDAVQNLNKKYKESMEGRYGSATQ